MRNVDIDTPHLWRQTARAIPATRPALAGEVTADVAIVGGGFSALSSAIAASEAGLKVAVLERDYIGSGASGRNNGLVLSHHSKATTGEVEGVLGQTRGAAYNGLVAGAPGVVFDLVDRYGIDCDLVREGWIQPAHSEKTTARARAFHDGWKAFGAEVEWLDRAAVTARLGAPGYVAGWWTKNAGHINPFALVQGYARAAESLGAVVFEGSGVTAIRPEGTRWRVDTAGGSVVAREVVVATNALTGAFWPKLQEAMIPVKVFQAATAPVPPDLRETILVGNPAVSDMRRDIRAFHYDAAGRIVTGGTHTLWHDAARRGMARTAPMVAETFPALRGIGMEHYWEGILAVVPDRLPRLMRLAPGVTFLGVYSGRGVALSTALGRTFGAFLAGNRDEAGLPVPLTDLRVVPSHGIAVRVASYIHPLHRLQDRLP
ncbi:NAD(P)/FAD-dependent oxidoreductase [Methylobrevis pamukkalensis]|uniref:Gamma-glutamylputrescine oxidoreductase n=1 Tax=Methylobrevis pamukkalensis TaxID=1439726 RepID=A0A1E3H4I8_9HYPH|nr:FAD-binding oxidoreductase [Methylobrevis pamukkalensis]ODN71243.1 Gamma-glutamylputrescine oxidoreductase [Methylobrevis pamukkalensis]